MIHSHDRNCRIDVNAMPNPNSQASNASLMDIKEDVIALVTTARAPRIVKKTVMKGAIKM